MTQQRETEQKQDRRPEQLPCRDHNTTCFFSGMSQFALDFLSLDFLITQIWTWGQLARRDLVIDTN